MSNVSSTNTSSNGLSIFDGNAGLAQNSEGVTIKALLINVLSGIVLFIVQILTWQLLRTLPRMKSMYQPKTYLVPLKKRWKVPPNNPITWFITLWKTPNKDIMQKSGIDTYFFLRYLTMLLKLFVPISCLVLPILLPLNKIGGANANSYNITGIRTLQNYNVSGLDAFSWQNVAPTHTSRFWAHLILAVIVVVYALCIFYMETMAFIKLRQEWLTSPQHRLKASASTILVMGIPEKWSSREALDALYDVYPGGIRRIWLNRNYDPLAYLVARRDDLLNLLEEAELQLIQAANRRYRDKAEKEVKREKRRNSHAKQKSNECPKDGGPHTSSDDKQTNEKRRISSNSGNSEYQETSEEVIAKEGEHTKDNVSHGKERSSTSQADDEEIVINEDYANDASGDALWMEYAKKGDRHTIRILRWNFTFWTTVPLWNILGLPFSKQVDTIYYTRREIALINCEIESKLKDLEKYPQLSSAFIQFNSQMAAHMACAMLSHHTPGRMAPRYLELAPNEIAWANLSLKWYERYLWNLFVFVTFLCILFIWGIPVTFTGFLTQLGSLRFQVSWLKPLRNVSSGFISILAGPVPAILLQLLVTAIVPTLLRWLCGLIAPTSSLRELYLQAYYFTFLFVELFLVVSISSGISVIVPEIISNPTSVPTILAKNLPKASNYFFNYMTLHALSISATVLLQLPRLLNKGFNRWLSATPRQIFLRSTSLPHHNWGSFYPFYTIFAVIGLIFCIISPLILVFVLLMFSLFWVVHRNNSLYVTRQMVDTGGLLHARAIQQLFTGLYFMEAALIGLFFLVRDSQNRASAKAQAIIMIVVLALTAIFHYLMNRNLAPYFEFLPITLEDEAVERSGEFEAKMAERQRLMRTYKAAVPAVDKMYDVKKSTDTANTLQNSNTEGVELLPLSGSNKSKEKLVTNAEESDAQEITAAALLPTEGSVVKEKKTGDEKATVDVFDASRAATQRVDLARFLSRRRPKHKDAVFGGVGQQPKHEEIEAQLAKDPIGKIMTEYNDELEDFSPEEIDMLTQVAYTHPATHPKKRIAWIPDDDLGISKDEIQRTAKFTKWLEIDNRCATLAPGPACKVQISKPPPDFSPFWLIESEL